MKIPKENLPTSHIQAAINSMRSMTSRSLSIPRITLPDIRVPTNAERHEYESAGDFVQRLQRQIQGWEQALPDDAQTVVWVVLSNGMTIDVIKIMADGHHAVKVIGKIEETETMTIMHISQIQVVCFVKQLQPEQKRHTIGFTPD